MKILLQTEARTVSNDELAKNQKYLIDLLTKVGHLKVVSKKSFSSSS